MIDSFGRNITYLRISATELCNLRCRYCMPEDGIHKLKHEDMLTEDEIIMAPNCASPAASRWSKRILYPSAAGQLRWRASEKYVLPPTVCCCRSWQSL